MKKLTALALGAEKMLYAGPAASAATTAFPGSVRCFAELHRTGAYFEYKTTGSRAEPVDVVLYCAPPPNATSHTFSIQPRSKVRGELACRQGFAVDIKFICRKTPPARSAAP
jgi:hypothetical protein